MTRIAKSVKFASSAIQTFFSTIAISSAVKSYKEYTIRSISFSRKATSAQGCLVFGSDLGFYLYKLSFFGISRAKLAPTAEKCSRI